MKYLAAYLLLCNGGNTSPCADDIKNVLNSVGCDIDEDRLSKLLSELQDKDINELIAEGSSKLASVPSGGSGGSAPAASAGGSAPTGGAAPAEEKEEKEEEESDEDMGFGLFD